MQHIITQEDNHVRHEYYLDKDMELPSAIRKPYYVCYTYGSESEKQGMTNKEAHRILSNGLVDAPSEHEWCIAFEMAIKALEQEPKWIPVSERLPEEAYCCIVTVMDTNPMTCDEFENIYPGFVGWDGENWNDADGNSIPFEVIAWQPLPEPYKAESEE